MGRSSRADLILRLALDGDDVSCITQLGTRRHLVIQRALRLADDPAAASAYPELVRRMREHAAQRAARRRPMAPGMAT